MKPLLLVPIVAGMVLMPSSGMLNHSKPAAPADLYTRSFSEQMQSPRAAPSSADLRATEYAARYVAYDKHHEVLQTMGHSGVVSPKPNLL